MDIRKTNKKTLKKQIKASQTDDKLWFSLASHYFRELKFVKAIKSIKQAISIKEEKIEYWIMLGISAYYSEKIDEAVEAFKVALQINPNLSIAETYIEYIQYRKNRKLRHLENLSIPDLNFLRLFIKSDEDIKTILKNFYFENKSFNPNKNLNLKNDFKKSFDGFSSFKPLF